MGKSYSRGNNKPGGSWRGTVGSSGGGIAVAQTPLGMRSAELGDLSG